jgi:tetratricopeptide (TPR) repeat protein
LVQQLDGLPLALATAGAYLYQVSTSFADYLGLYKASWLRLQQKTPELLSYEDRALYSTWNISLDHVKEQSELATKLLQLWAYFDNQDVWLELLQAGREGSPAWFSELTENQLSFDAVVRVLCGHALVEADAAFGGGSKKSGGYAMHSCVHAWTMHVVNERWDDEMARLALRCVGLHVPDTSALQYWVTQQRLLRHANCSWRSVDAVLASQENDTITVHAVHNFGTLYRDQSRLNEAEEMYERALQGREKALGPNHMSTLHTVNSLGILYRGQGRLDKAEEMFERALKGRTEAFGPDHTSTFQMVNNLGLLYADQDRLDKAKEMYKRALEGWEKALGYDHMLTLQTVSNLGNFYRDQGKLNEAEEMYERALKGRTEALGPDHTSTLQTVNNLGLLYADRGRLDKAEEMYERALEGRTDTLGPDHTLTLNTVNNLGAIYIDQGKLDAAKEMYQRALAGYEKRLGWEHARCCRLRETLASLENDIASR